MFKLKIFLFLFTLLVGFVAAASNRNKELQESEKKQITSTRQAKEAWDKTASTAPGYGQAEQASTAHHYTQHAYRAADENIAAQRQNVRDQFAKHWQERSSKGH
ncbi:uncharacterized protein FA14DRAFT_175936 [Meira miltonrushii]|uniref:Uncharacterized protein n=1 Tax=Meira miltonrushii TaxID=1280837 RepID=A0A316VM34_9BASI|nr:uncharacterized protein FA14DRAFT_175936 [Meira miltonrushii]PWN36625.1 hypothetical protein FA14DRAFT_175936 [Meira miltonrushii]